MKTPEPIADAADKAKDLYNDTVDKAKDAYGDATNKTKDLYNDTVDKVKDAYGDVADKGKGLYNQAADKGQDLLDQVPAPVKKAGAKTAEAFNKLSTTQKVVGGALLLAGLSYLVAPKKAGKTKRTKAALGQLLLYVNDRVAGYKKAAAETKDGDLRSYYQQLVTQSKEFADTLNKYLTKKGGERETSTTLKGKLYRKLMAAQAAVTGHDEKATLAANVYGERWAIKAYKKALRRKALKGDLREAVQKQFAASKKTYKKLKELTAQQK